MATESKLYSRAELSEPIQRQKLELPKNFEVKIRELLGEDEDNLLSESHFNKLTRILADYYVIDVAHDRPFGPGNKVRRLKEIVKAAENLKSQLVDCDHRTQYEIESGGFGSMFHGLLTKLPTKSENHLQKVALWLVNNKLGSPYSFLQELLDALISTCQKRIASLSKEKPIKSVTKAAKKITLDSLSRYFDSHQLMQFNSSNKADMRYMDDMKLEFLSYCLGLFKQKVARDEMPLVRFNPEISPISETIG